MYNIRKRESMRKVKTLLNRIHFHSDYINWLWVYSKPYVPQIAFLLLIGLINSTITVSLAVVSKTVIDSAITGELKKNAIVIYIVLVIVLISISALTSLISVVLKEKFSFGIRKQLYRKIIESSWMDVTKFHTGDLMTRLTSDAGNISEGIIKTIPNIFSLVIQMIVTFGVLYYYEPIMAIFALLIGPIAAIISIVLGRKLKRLQVKVQESEASYRSFLQESLSHLLIVKAFCNEQYSTNKLIRLREERFFWVKKKTKLGVISSSSMSLTFQLGYIAAFSFGSFQVASGAITYGTMTVFLTLVNRIQNPIFQLANSIPQIVSMLASVGRVIELQDIKLENKETSIITEKPIGLNIRDMTFGYKKDEALFNKAEVVIEPNDFVAVVGESGIGKTTLIRIIMSFLKQEEGTVAFRDKNNNYEHSNASSREYISYVPQGNTLFSGSIRENVLTGNVDASEAETIEALKVAAAYEFVMDLPNGLDTHIGEKGHGISEGQAQRIAIARAVIKKAPFLILDEATSSLDDDTEINVLKGIKSFCSEQTCLMITHRHSILNYCNKELRIKDKKIFIRSIQKV